LESYTYDAFGAPRFYNATSDHTQSAPGLHIKHLFQGQLWTQETGLKDYRNRVELPTMGVFLQPDPKFESCLVLKGDKKIARFQLHHYRYRSADDEDAVANTPEFVKITRGRKTTFLLFLVRESDGKYVPVTGQTDPALFSVLLLKGGQIDKSGARGARRAEGVSPIFLKR
jgi:RHS repeat-associated protein